MEDRNQSEEGGLDSMGGIDFVFVPTSYIRQMRGTYLDMERASEGSTHIVDKVVGYAVSGSLEVARLGAYGLLASIFV